MFTHSVFIICAVLCQGWLRKCEALSAWKGLRVNIQHRSSIQRHSDAGSSFSDAFSSLNSSQLFSRTIQLGTAYAYSVPSFPHISKDNATAAFNGLLRSVSQPIVGMEALEMRERVQRLERRVSTLFETVESSRKGLSFDPISTSGNEVVSALSRKTLLITPRTVEICAIAVFFLFGALVGKSLLDRLWLIGGIVTASWAYTAFHRNTRGGTIVRSAGACIAQGIQDVQEKYNQAFVFYKTGRLAYVSSKTWEKYDRQFSVTQRLNVLKRAALQRASEFNSTFDARRRSVLERATDLWSLAQPPVKREVWNGLVSESSQFLQGGLAAALQMVSPAFLRSRKVAVLSAGVVTRVVARVAVMFGPPEIDKRGDLTSRFVGKGRSSRGVGGGKTAKDRATQTRWARAPALVRSLLGVKVRDSNLEARNARGNLINPWSLPFALTEKPTRSTWVDMFPNIIYGGKKTTPSVAVAPLGSEQTVTLLLTLLICIEAAKLINVS